MQRQHHETTEYQQPTSAADISHLATNHGADQIHGPNRKSLTDSRSSPRNTTSQQTTNRDNHQTAEYQHSSNAQKTINRYTGHQTAHASGPNRKSHTNLGSSPLARYQRPERSLGNHLRLALAEGEADYDGDEAGESGEVGVFVGVVVGVG